MAMNLDQSADKITPSSGSLNIAGGATLTTALPIASGGTALSSAGSSGNVLVSNGTNFVLQGLFGGTF